MTQKVHFNNLTGDSLTIGNTTISGTGVSASELTIGNTVITGTGVAVGGEELGGGGATVYANASVLPTSGLTAGELAFTGNSVFITNGSGWYRIAVLNETPTISLSTQNVLMGGLGNTLFFTYTALDNDGTTPTVTVSNSGISNTDVAIITHYTANNTVKIENFSATDWNGTITLTASDGINSAFDSLTVTVAYVATEWADTVASINVENDVIVDSTGTNTLTLRGNVTASASQTKYASKSIYFDGSSDMISLSNGSSYRQFNNSTGFTMEMWVYPTTLKQGQNNGLFISHGGVFDNPDYWGFGITSSGYLRMGYYVSGTVLITASTNPLVANEWSHVAFCYEGSTAYGYVNGTRVFASGLTGTPLTSASHSLHIGWADDGSYEGYMENIQILWNVAKYTGTSFTVPFMTQGEVYQATD